MHNNRKDNKPAKADQEKETRGGLGHSTVFLVFLCVLLISVCVVLVFMLKNHNDAKKGASEQLRLSAIAGFDCEYTEAQQLYPFMNGLLKVTTNRITYMSISGNEIYGVDVEMSSPICKIAGGYAMVADSDGFFCAMFSEDGLVFNKHMTGKIGNVALTPSGLSAVIIDEGKSFGDVYIMEKDSSFLAQWTSNESGYPLSLEFSPDETILSVSLVDTDGSQMVPHVKQFLIPKDRANERPSEYAFYSPLVSDIMPIVAYAGDGRLAVAGIGDVAVVGNGECKLIEPGFACVTTIFSYDGGFGVVYSDGLDQPVRLAVFNSNGSKKTEIDLGNSLLNYDVSGSSALIAVDEKIMLINMASGKVESTIPVDETVIRVSFFGKKNICLVTSVGVRELTV
ncbi:MAG: hypothetical protein J5752_06460 [Clostridiales bacterium]|nr:hypothetical protein [Clostridiales bacterium]